MKHTALALPWVVGGNHVDRDNLQIASLGDYIGEVYGYDEKAKARLEHIVRACNSHDELVEACKAIIPFCLFLDTSLSPDQGIGMKEAWHKLQQALANATK